jgi:hypothetical protein
MCDLCQIIFFFNKFQEFEIYLVEKTSPSFSNHRKHLHLMLNVNFHFKKTLKNNKNNNLTTFQ